jgi:BirA family transcriptional regulator, biotin operon repressor / biotin---[acetyl-CoA-carboxylase] ligase
LWKIYLSKKKHISFISDIIESSSNNFIFKDFYYFDRLPSTQDFALNLVKRKKKLSPSVIICNSQTCGKGRKGSAWYSPKGGIWMSLILETRLKLENLYFLVMISAICICETIEKETFGLKPDIKWPNDIFVNGKKVAGVLLDVETGPDDSTNRIVLGIGINSNNDVNSTILEIKKNNAAVSAILPHYKITTLKKEFNGVEISNISFMSSLLSSLNIFFSKIIKTDYILDDYIVKSYKERIIRSKDFLPYSFKNENNVEFEGKIIDVSDDGSLLVRDIHHKKIVRLSSANNVNVE